jgi:hypothetical protein
VRDAVAVKLTQKFTVLALADIQGVAMQLIALSFKFRRHWIEAKLPLTLLFPILPALQRTCTTF